MPECLRTLRTFLVAAALLASASLPQAAHPADRLILRNLEILTDRTVTAIDDDGLQLDAPRENGRDRIPWDQVERGTVAMAQSKFDTLLSELGQPLYRVRQRLKIGDYEALAEPAELLYPRYASRRSQTAYMVCQATMWSRLALNRQEEAVEPYLRCFELLRSGAASRELLPGTRRLETDPATGISPDLLPICFNSDAAKAALPGVQDAIRGITQPRPEGVYVYFTSLALAAGDVAAAERVLGSIRGETQATAQWQSIVLAQQAINGGDYGSPVDTLREGATGFLEPARPAALYWLGLADSRSADVAISRDGILALLTLPAEYGRSQPELAAASLYHAALALDKLKDDRGANAVRHELTANYASTEYAARAKSESMPGP